MANSLVVGDDSSYADKGLSPQTEQPVIFIIWSPFSSFLLLECLSRMPAIHPSPLNDRQLCYLKTTRMASSSAIITAAIKQTLLSSSLCHRKTGDNNSKSIQFNLCRTCDIRTNAFCKHALGKHLCYVIKYNRVEIQGHSLMTLHFDVSLYSLAINVQEIDFKIVPVNSVPITRANVSWLSNLLCTWETDYY